MREKPFFTLEEAVRKVTSFPASILGIPDRGRIEEGCWADMVIFDPEKIADRSNYDIPEAYPEGIPYVFVNGTAVVEEGETVTCTPGKVLRHGK